MIISISIAHIKDTVTKLEKYRDIIDLKFTGK